MRFQPSTEMKITLAPEQEEMLSTKDDIKLIIRKNPDTVKAFDIYDGADLIGFVLVHRFEDRKYFLWEYAIDLMHQNRHKGTRALSEFLDFMKTQYGAEQITTTYLYGNDHAKHVYETVGFTETDVVDEPDCHEVNMAYDLRPARSVGSVEKTVQQEETMLQIGRKGHIEKTVTDDMSAAIWGSGELDVYATPCMIALAEETAWRSVQDGLEPGQATVGTKIDVAHLAATPIGMRVWCDTELKEIDRRRLVFSVSVFDEAGKIAEGTHERFIVDVEKFRRKTAAKAGR